MRRKTKMISANFFAAITWRKKKYTRQTKHIMDLLMFCLVVKIKKKNNYFGLLWSLLFIKKKIC